MKIMSLNIWHYEGNWSARMKNIVKSVKSEKPDILFMQEVADDRAYQAKDGPHQGEKLNRLLGYKNRIYDIAEQIRAFISTGELNRPFFDGDACLTDLPVLEHRVLRLKREKEDKHYRFVQIVKVSWHGSPVLFYNTHFSNNSEWSRLQLEEIRKYISSNEELPILVGDLNILDPKDVKTILGKKFESSYEFKKYISYPSKNEVLDYIVIPKGICQFKSFKCAYDECSDHRALIAEIDVKGLGR